MTTPSTDSSARRRSLWADVKDQFFGSDLQTGYSFVYVWLTNQFGHFMIGFAGTLLCGWILSIFAPDALTSGGALERFRPALATGLAWLGVWILKEVYVDIGGALRDLRLARAQRAARSGEEPALPAPDRRLTPTVAGARDVSSALWNHALRRDRSPSEEDWFRHDVLVDSRMDFWFYFSGAATAVAAYVGPGLAADWNLPALAGLLPIAVLAAVLGLSVRLSRNWLRQKVGFDKAMLPFVGRFALSSGPSDRDVRERALAFALERREPGHLIIIGPPKSGRTTTAVALGVEALLRADRPIVVYTTLCKLLDRVAEEKHLHEDRSVQGAPGDRPVWPPEEAEFLIIDDVGAQGVDGAFLIPRALGTELRANDRLCRKVEDKRVIWVVGDGPDQARAWAAMLRTAFGEHAPIDIVQLTAFIRPENRLHPMRRAA